MLISTPNLKPYTNLVESPKEVLAYLRAGCEIKQVGCNQRAGSNKEPKYYLISPWWEVELQTAHVQALETLGLIEVDCCGGNYWISKQNFHLPEINRTTVEQV